MEKEKAPARKTHSDSLARRASPFWFLFFSVAACVIFAWRQVYPTYAWHEKVTLTVEAPEGVKTASSVLSTTYEPAWLEGPAVGFDSPTITRRGEAVVMDMGDGRYLFSLLKGLPDAWIVFTPGQGPADVPHEIENMRATKALVADQYPLLVTFDDINDPASVKRADPENLAATFGPGYRLKSITMSITDEPVTKAKVESVLGWLGPYPETPLLSKIDSRDFSFEAKLRQGDFIRR